MHLESSEPTSLKPATAWALCLTLVVVAIIGDFATGPFFVFDLFYLVPVLIASRTIGRTTGLVFAAACAALAVGVQALTGHPIREHPLLIVWSVAMKFGVMAIAAWLVCEYQRQVRRQSTLIVELQAAMAEIKQLKGLLPVCAWCRRMRTDDGSWLRLEDYLQERTDASVTHSICPECAAKAIQSVGKGKSRA